MSNGRHADRAGEGRRDRVPPCPDARSARPDEPTYPTDRVSPAELIRPADADADADRSAAQTIVHGPPPDFEPNPGAMLGRYVVLEPLGRGGMGVVVAAFDSVLERKVALKLVRPVSADGRAAARGRAALKREAQALAALCHPNVVPIYDVGEFSVPGGAPGLYIAMELEAGQTLRTWGQRVHPWHEVVDVFLEAGNGLHAAHVAGIVHGDFKPANVLRRDDGRVVVVDFGLARHSSQFGGPQLQGHRGTLTRSGIVVPVAGESTFAEPGFVMGTPAYLAPEQYKGCHGEAADQFAFCVSLYRTLFGRHPFAASDGGEESIAHRIQRGARAPGVPVRAGLRSVERVIARGLSHEPHRRWPGMGALLHALRRARRSRRRAVVAVLVGVTAAGGAAVVLSTTPSFAIDVTAEVPELAHAWSDARRHRLRAAVVQLGETASGATGPQWLAESARAVEHDLDGYVQAWSEQYRYLRRSPAPVDATERADWRGKRACLDDALAEMAALVDVLVAADLEAWAAMGRPAAALPRPDSCRVVDRARDDLAVESSAARGARRLLTRARTHLRAGQTAAARDAAARAGTVARDHDAMGLAAHADKLLAEALADAGDFEGATDYLQDTAWSCSLLACDALAFEAMASLATIYAMELGELSKATQWEARARWRLRHLGGRDASLEATLSNAVGVLRLARGEYVEAEAAFREMAEHVRGLSDAEIRLASVYNNIGNALEAQGRAADAVAMLGRSVAIRETVLGANHPTLAAGLSNLGLAELAADDVGSAQRHFERAIEITEAAWGSDHLSLASYHNNLANVHYSRGSTEAARASYERTLRVLQRGLGNNHPNVALTLGNLGLVQDDAADALALHRRALAVLERSVPEQHPYRGMALNNIGSALRGLGRLDEARYSYERALSIREAALGPGHPLVATTVDNLGTTALLAGDPQAAVRLHERSLEIWSAAYGDDHRKVALAQTGLAAALVAARPQQEEQMTRARRLAQVAVDGASTRSSDPADLAAAWVVLASALMVPPNPDAARARVLATRAKRVFTGPAAQGRRWELEAIAKILDPPRVLR